LWRSRHAKLIPSASDSYLVHTGEGLTRSHWTGSSASFGERDGLVAFQDNTGASGWWIANETKNYRRVFAFYVTFTFVGCSQPETETDSQPGVQLAVNDAVDRLHLWLPACDHSHDPETIAGK